MYFWRSIQQQEVDYVEEKGGGVSGFEFKWMSKKGKLPKTFTEAYNAPGKIVDRENFRGFMNMAG